MPRPRKPENERLVKVTAYITPLRESVLERRAAARGVALAVVLREYLDPSFRTVKNDDGSQSP